MRSRTVVCARFIRNDRVAQVICLLKPCLAFTGDGETPDVVWPGRQILKQRTVQGEPGELGVIEGDFREAVGKRDAARAANGRTVK